MERGRKRPKPGRAEIRPADMELKGIQMGAILVGEPTTTFWRNSAGSGGGKISLSEDMGDKRINIIPSEDQRALPLVYGGRYKRKDAGSLDPYELAPTLPYGSNFKKGSCCSALA